MRKALRKYGFQILLNVIMVPLVMFAATKIQHAYIVNSQIEATPIGVVTPADGHFTNLYATSTLTTPVGIFSGLAAGNCVQTTTGGQLTTTGFSCLEPFNGTSGYQTVRVNGQVIYFVWGQTANFDTGPSSVTFPITLPHGCLIQPMLTQNQDISTTTRQWESGACTTTGFSARNDGLGQAGYLVIGY